MLRPRLKLNYDCWAGAGISGIAVHADVLGRGPPMDFGHGGVERRVPCLQLGMRGEVRWDKLTDLGHDGGIVDRLQAAIMNDDLPRYHHGFDG